MLSPYNRKNAINTFTSFTFIWVPCLSWEICWLVNHFNEFVTFINVWQGDTTTVIQYHTSQDHFCSVIDEFPVWNSEPNQPTMMSWAAVLEREKELEPDWAKVHWWSLIFLYWKMEGIGAVWVVFKGMLTFFSII